MIILAGFGECAQVAQALARVWPPIARQPFGCPSSQAHNLPKVMPVTCRLYRRKNGKYYARHNETGRLISLRTSGENPAKLLLPGHNEGRRAAQVSRAVGLAYLSCTDPAARKRTWVCIFAEVLKTKSQDTDNYRRWRVAIPHISANLAPARPIFPPTFPNYFSKFRFPETKILKIKVLYGVFCDF